MKKILILLCSLSLLLVALAADNPSIRLIWNPSPSVEMVHGYKMYWGPTSRVYTASSNLPFGYLMTNYPPVTNYSQVPPYPRIEHMDTNAWVYFSVTAWTTNGGYLESDFSNEAWTSPDFWRSNRIMGVASSRMKQ